MTDTTEVDTTETTSSAPTDRPPAPPETPPAPPAAAAAKQRRQIPAWLAAAVAAGTLLAGVGAGTGLGFALDDDSGAGRFQPGDAPDRGDEMPDGPGFGQRPDGQDQDGHFGPSDSQQDSQQDQAPQGDGSAGTGS